MRLKDKVAIITGSNDGIGKATAILFAKEGAKVTIVGRREKEGYEVVNEIEKNSGEAIFVKTDVSNEKDTENLIAKTVRAFGKLDILINNAAAQWMGTVLTAKPEDYDYLFSVNVKGYGMCAKYAIPYLRQSDDGVIVNVSSVNGVIGMPGQSLYNVTKAAIIELSKSMAIDFPELRINAILPGFTKTAALDGAMVGFENGVVDGSGIEEGYRLLSKGVLRKRIAEPIEIAKAILFLASSDASYITGSTLLVDGGIAGVKNPGRDLFADPRFSKVFGKVLGLSWLTGEDK